MLLVGGAANGSADGALGGWFEEHVTEKFGDSGQERGEDFCSAIQAVGYRFFRL